MIRFCLAFLLTLASFSSIAVEKIAVQFHWLEQFEFAGFYMAKEKGFYAESGLDVSFLPYQLETTNVVDSVLSGKAQYGVNYSSLIQNFHDQQPIVAIAALLQESPLVLMVAEDSKITKPQQLRGKKLMISGDALNSAPIMALLFSHGLTRSDIRKLKHSHRLEDLASGVADAMTAFISNEPFEMKEKGYGFRIFDPKDSNLSFYENFLFTSKNEVDHHPDRVARFYKATKAGWDYAFENIEETARLLEEKYNEQGKSYQSLVYEGYELRKLAYKDGVSFGDVSLEKLEKIEDAYRLMGISLSTKPINDFIWEGALSDEVFFTSDERWFIEHTEIEAVTTTDWVPISFVNSETGKPSGIGYEFWREIVQVAGLNSHVSSSESFTDELKGIESKQYDVIYSAGITEDRKQYALFSDPYASYPIVIATSKDEGFIHSIDQLKGRRIAVGRNFTAHKMMEKAYPGLDYVLVSNARQGLQQVSRNAAYAYVDIMPILVQSINRYGFTNLKISGSTGLNFDLRVMVRKDFAALIPILNKVIANISAERKQEIINKWMNVQQVSRLNLTRYWPQASIILLSLTIIMLWMHKSKKTAQMANAAKSEFLASMSHEIRTPMTSILGFADLLLSDDLPDGSKEKVLQIQASTNSLLHILNDILDMSKLDAGKLELEFLGFNLKKLVTDTAAVIQKSHLHDKAVTVRVDFSVEVSEHVSSDQKRIRQVLLNLMGNAAKFTQKGEIEIRVRLADGAQGRFVRIEVRDTGIGIREEIVDSLFSPFTQADASISRKYEGTGLGLAICKRLVDLLHGEIGVESQVGKGSVFWFSFPYLAADETEVTSLVLPELDRKALSSRLKILLAEDNKVNQIIIKKLLSPYGHQVDIAGNGHEAITRHRNNDYDLILMDIRMPGMNGTDATKIIRSMSGNKSRVPIVAVTADVLNEKIDEYLACGMSACIHKPIVKEELLRVVDKVVIEAALTANIAQKPGSVAV